MENFRLNTNYAKALFLLAEKPEEQKAVYEDMQTVSRVCRENHVLGTVFRNPVIKATKKSAIINDLFEGSVGKLTLGFLQFVVRKNRTVNLQGISEAYSELYRDAYGIVRTELRTAMAVDDGVKEAARKLVGDYTRKDVLLETVEDNTMLGGLSLSFNNNMYDARMRTKLAKLRREFSKNIYESKL
ncbi:MAG: ATP synthase F1 subunit delta [Bacteroidales bacterium]|nr:ATP synthase F1 subunit delta [Bacteroidales bacterium]